VSNARAAPRALPREPLEGFVLFDESRRLFDRIIESLTII
jgi:hypothetical protein